MPSYTARNAWMLLSSRAARTAGRKPPMGPIGKENGIEFVPIDDESANEKASSEKEPKLRAEVKN
jgi:hypothetical protein